MSHADSPEINASPRPQETDVREERRATLSREEFEQLAREGQKLRQEMQKRVDEFRKDPNRNRYRWL